MAGRYRVEDTLGEGGMGYVLRARHVELDQRVAIKLMRSDVSHVWSERFLREARAASRIENDHVARVFDMSRLEDGTPYMVMELLEGRDLGAMLEERGPLPIDEAVDYARQACLALAAAHELGIIHRDVKPENLFVAEGGDGGSCLKLLDFGVSKEASLATEAPAPLTRTHAMLGSPQFMSPEQLVSCRDVDPRTDLWALGATLFELLTYEHAFPADTLAELYSKILRDPPRRLREVLSEAPERLEAVISRCLEKRPEDRFADAEALEEALAEAASAVDRTDAFEVRDTLPAVVSGDVVRFDETGSLGLDDQTPTVRPVVRETSPATSAPASARWSLSVGAVIGMCGILFGLVSALRSSPRVAQELSPAVPVVFAQVAPSPEPALGPPGEGHQEKDPSRFMDSVPLPEAVRSDLESHLAAGTENLEQGDLAAATAQGQAVLETLASRGIRPNEAVSSVGAQAALLLGQVEARKLERMLAAPMSRREEGERHAPKLDRQMALVRTAYGRVRRWNVQSFHRCALVETASLELAIGQRFSEAASEAHAADRIWFVKAASARLRNARLELRHALGVRTETMLCVEKGRSGLEAAKRLLQTLPRIP